MVPAQTARAAQLSRACPRGYRSGWIVQEVVHVAVRNQNVLVWLCQVGQFLDRLTVGMEVIAELERLPLEMSKPAQQGISHFGQRSSNAAASAELGKYMVDDERVHSCVKLHLVLGVELPGARAAQSNAQQQMLPALARD